MPPGFGNRRRQSLRDVLVDILRRAAEWPADVVLVAGDLFEHDRVTRDTVGFLQEAFANAAPVPICIAPGNHDPCVPGSPYMGDWPDNVHVFRDPEWRSHALADCPVTVHGFGFDGREISNNPFGRLEIPQDGRLHVAVAHGSEMGALPPEKGAYAPFSAADAAAEGLTYLALGHYHGLKAIKGDFGTHMYYSGAPEGHGFDEPGPHFCIEAEIGLGGVQVRPVKTCRAVYNTFSLDCSEFRTSQQLIDAIRKLPAEPGIARLARVTLTGTRAAEWNGRTLEVYDAVSPEFDYLLVDDQTCAVEDYDALASEPTSLGAFVARLNAELEDASDPARRRRLERAREVGVAAFRERGVEIRGFEEGR